MTTSKDNKMESCESCMINDDDKIEVCESCMIHNNVVDDVKKHMLEEEKFYRLSELFKVLGDCTRTKLMYALFESEMCVCDIADLLGMSQSAISHQLRVLKQARLVKFRKEGKTVYYSLNDDHVKSIFYMGLAHINEK